MEKLVKRFESMALGLRTFDVSLPNIIMQQKALGKDCAEEAKKIAIDFAIWTLDNSFRRMFRSEPKGWQKITADITEWPYNMRTVSNEELFNKFLETYGE